MNKFNAQHKFHGACEITKLNCFNDFLEFLKTEPVVENSETDISSYADDFIFVGQLFNAGNKEVFAINNHADVLKYEIFPEDWVEVK